MKTINHEHYVLFEVAKLLKKAGFDWETFSHWTESDVNNSDFKFSGLSDKPILYDGYTPIDEDACVGRKKDWNNYNNECPLIYNYSAPTLEVAQRWLREVKQCYVHVYPMFSFEGTLEYYFVEVIYPRSRNIKPNEFDTYEEALEAGIKKALELILKKGE